MNRVAFVTGGTGLLGSWLARTLIDSGYRKVYILVRGGSKRFEHKRSVPSHFQARWQVSKERALDFSGYDGKAEILKGDICKRNLDLSTHALRSLRDEVTDVFHSAAIADFRIPLHIIRIPNVEGTRNVCRLILSISRTSGRKVRMHQISTVGIAGTLQGWFSENDFDKGQGFHNPYERTKFEAEKIVTGYRSQGLNATIYRPAVITGDSRLGATTNFKMFYQPLHFLALGLFKKFPAEAECLHSLVPVDKVAYAIALLSGLPEPPCNAWHLVNPNETSVGDFFEVASRVFGFKKPALIPFESFPRTGLSPVQWNLIKPFVPYFNYHVRFRATETNNMLRLFGFSWPEAGRPMLAKLFHYCIQCGYIRPKVSALLKAG